MSGPFELCHVYLSFVSPSFGKKGKEVIKLNLSNVKARIKPKIFLVLAEEFFS